MLDPVSGLRKIGEAKLKVLFWDIYNSTLYNSTGEYIEGQYPLVLKIDYLRDVDAKDLIERAQDEWLKLGAKREMLTHWISLLSEMFPNIKKGDTLLLSVCEDQRSEFIFNGLSIGKISDQKFGASFLGIWLDEKCSFPSVRNKLIGRKR